jgi:hypothetical protein
MVEEGQEIIESSKYSNPLGRGAGRASDGRIAGIACRGPCARTLPRFNFPSIRQKWWRKAT